MIGNDCTGSCKFNYHTTTTVQVQLRWKVIVLLILMEFMIITVYNWFAESRFICWGSLDGICRHNVRHIRTIPFFFANRLGWLATEFTQQIASQWGLQLIFRMHNRNILLWIKCVLTALHVNCMILFDKVL